MGKKMNTLKAILIMSLWTAILFTGLYLLDAHKNYQNIVWALAIGITLLITHIINMVIYFKITGDRPYRWFQDK